MTSCNIQSSPGSWQTTPMRYVGGGVRGVVIHCMYSKYEYLVLFPSHFSFPPSPLSPYFLSPSPSPPDFFTLSLLPSLFLVSSSTPSYLCFLFFSYLLSFNLSFSLLYLSSLLSSFSTPFLCPSLPAHSFLRHWISPTPRLSVTFPNQWELRVMPDSRVQ